MSDSRRVIQDGTAPGSARILRGEKYAFNIPFGNGDVDICSHGIAVYGPLLGDGSDFEYQFQVTADQIKVLAAELVRLGR